MAGIDGLASVSIITAFHLFEYREASGADTRAAWPRDCDHDDRRKASRRFLGQG